MVHFWYIHHRTVPTFFILSVSVIVLYRNCCKWKFVFNVFRKHPGKEFSIKVQFLVQSHVLGNSKFWYTRIGNTGPVLLMIPIEWFICDFCHNVHSKCLENGIFGIFMNLDTLFNVIILKLISDVDRREYTYHGTSRYLLVKKLFLL